jgi:hypothetical protein
MQTNDNKREWLTRKEILEMYPIGTTTYKRRIKKLKNPKYQKYTRLITKRLENSNLKQIQVREIHIQITDELFGNSRIPKQSNVNQVIKWVNNTKWDWFANIRPSKCYPVELEGKIRLFHKNLKLINRGQTKITLFYSIEKTKYDGYYHCHFLIKASNKNLNLEIIHKCLNLICEENTRTETPQYVKPYNYGKFQNRGVSYSMKELGFGYGILK